MTLATDVSDGVAKIDATMVPVTPPWRKSLWTGVIPPWWKSPMAVMLPPTPMAAMDTSHSGAERMDTSHSGAGGSECFSGGRGPFLPATPSFPPPPHLLRIPSPKRRRRSPQDSFDAESNLEPLREMLGNRQRGFPHTMRVSELVCFSGRRGPVSRVTPPFPPPPHLLRIPSPKRRRSSSQDDFDAESNLQPLREIVGIFKEMLASLNSFEKHLAARLIEDHLHHQMVMKD